MSKSNNSHKILKSVALAGALTAAGTVATTTAHADTTATNAAPSQAPASANTADQQLANLKSQQTANENTVAQNNQATMTSATNAANGQIADLNAQIQQRQASNAAANQAKVASETAQVNAAASSATDQENAAYSAAVASQQAANDTALKSAQANIVTPAQKAQQTAQENASYQNKAGNLNIAHNQNLNKIDTDAANQTKAVNDQITKTQDQIKANHQKAIDNATKQVDSQIADAQKNVNDVQGAVTSDQNTVNSAKTANDQAQQASQNAQKVLDQDQDSLKSLQDKQNDRTTDKLIVPQDYINVWKEFAQKYHADRLTENAQPDLWQRNHKDSIEAKRLNSADNFKVSKADQEAPIVFNNDGTLSKEGVVIATQYAAELINPIREAIGMNPYRITNASIAMTMENSQKYHALGHTWGHDFKLGKQIAHEWGTDHLSESLAGFSGGYSFVKSSNFTAADLKKAVYESVVMLLFEGSNDGSGNGHTTDLLGVCYAKDNALAKEHNIHGEIVLGGSDLLGVNFEYNKANNDCIVRFNSIADGKSPRIQQEQGYGIRSGSANDKTIQGHNYDQIAIPSDDQSSVAKQISQLQTKVANDQTAVNAAKSKANTTAQALKSAQAKLAADQTALKTAQDKLASLKANRAQMIAKLATPEENTAVAKLQSQLKDIKAKHDQAVKTENARYQAELAKLTKDHQAKLDAIKAQPSDVNGRLKAQLQKKLDTLKANHEAKLAQIQKDADAKIAKIKADTQIDPEIAKLQDRIATIKANLAAQKKSLDDQYAALVASDQAAYQKLENQLKPSASEETAKGENDSYTTSDGKTVVLPHESTTTNGKTVVLPHETGEAQTTVSANHNAVTRPEVATTTPIATVNTTTPTTREEVKAQREGKLPQTGNQSALAAIVLGAASAMFGFGLAAKKRY